MRSGVIKLFIDSLNTAYNRSLTARWPLSKAQLNWQSLFIGVGLLAVFVAFMATLQFSSPNLTSIDGYFHIKFTQLMREQGPNLPFPWLPLTILNSNDYFDHHFLFHILLIPFTYGDLRLGAKWAGVIFPALAFLMGWVFLRGQRVPYAALWSLGFLAVSDAFLYRLSMPRVQAVSLLMLFLMLHFLLTRREHWLAPLAFLYVWLYDAFPFFGVIAIIYIGCRWLLDRQFDLKPLVYVSLGIALGLVINIYFPKNIIFIYHHFLPKLTDTTAIRVGNEWEPYQTWTLVERSALALVAFVGGTFALSLSQRRINTPTATLFWITVLFGFLLFKSRRFIEYYPAFALLFGALAWSSAREELLPVKPWLSKLEPVILIIILLPAMWYNFRATQESIQDSPSYQRYAQASAWFKANTPPGSLIYQTDWDDFPQLYFYNTSNVYTLGLDPTYMQLYDARLYELWRDISQGRIANPGPVIANTFDSHYILTDLNHNSFLKEAADDPSLEEVYRDDYAVILRVKTSP